MISPARCPRCGATIIDPKFGALLCDRCNPEKAMNYVPTVTRTIIDLGDPDSGFQIEREIRYQLSCSDPCDQREIWRLAAFTLGASEAAAMHADLVIEMISAEPEGHVWNLVGFNWTCRARTMDEATAALAAHIWGPK